MTGQTCRKCGGNNLSAHGDCRPCRAAYMREWTARNKQKVLDDNRRRRADPARREKKREADRAYREANRDALNARRAGYFKAVNAAPETKAYKKSWYEANKAALAAAAKARYEAKKHTPEFKAKRAEAERRRRECPRYRLNQRISTRVRQSLKGNKAGRSWELLVGYTLHDLTDRLRQTLPAGFTWDDFLAGLLEIDHKRPIASFRFESADDPEFRRCWALDNLQLLTPEENNRKRATLPAGLAETT